MASMSTRRKIAAKASSTGLLALSTLTFLSTKACWLFQLTMVNPNNFSTIFTVFDNATSLELLGDRELAANTTDVYTFPEGVYFPEGATLTVGTDVYYDAVLFEHV